MDEDFDVDWTLVSFEKPKWPAPEAAPKTPLAECPKCGRPLKSRGQHLHIRACKG